MVLRPNAAEAERMRAQVNREESGALAVADDGSEQSVWRHFYAEAYELPVEWNAFKSTVLAEADWGRVLVLHDANLLRKGGWRSENARLVPRLANLTAAANALVARADAAVRAEAGARAVRAGLAAAPARGRAGGGRAGARKARRVRYSEVAIYI